MGTHTMCKQNAAMAAPTKPTSSEFQVIGAGFGRTGTSSTMAALEKLLGGECYHMQAVIMNSFRGDGTHADAWVAAMAGKADEQKLKTVLAGCTAGLDWPLSTCYKELMEIYPDAKVLLTLHPKGADGWVKSFKGTIFEMMKAQRSFPVSWTLSFVPKFAKFFNVVQNGVRCAPELQGCAAATTLDEEKAKAAYIEHIEQVKRYVPSEKLLVFDATQGWEPLCAFLGKPVPDEPFPNVNDTAQFRSKISGMVRMGYMCAAGAALFASVVGYFIMRYQ